jgi:HAD superfamily hydrolase (TIGR01456 family)
MQILISNGPGTESYKQTMVAKLLNVSIEGERCILSTTTMQHIDCVKAGKRLLLCAEDSESCASYARNYGFKNWISIQDYALAHTHLNPCKAYTAPPGHSGDYYGEASLPIDAILILNIPDDWAEALQVCVDILRSKNGVPDVENEATDRQYVEIHSANPDFVYSASHSVERFTLGSFRKCLEMLYFESTGRVLEVTFHGKPYLNTFNAGMELLQKNATASNAGVIDAIYMVGDNPLSDIKGANGAGSPWVSCLVRTGCFKGGDNDSVNPAVIVKNDVEEVVDFVLKKHGIEV